MNPLVRDYPTMYHLLMAAFLAQDDGEEDWVDVELREAERYEQEGRDAEGR